MSFMNLEENNIESLVNTEAERVVLGTLMTEISTHNRIDDMSSNMFSERSSKSVFKAIDYLNRNEKSIDLPNISSVLKSKGIDISISSLTNLTMYGNLYSFKGSLEIIKSLQLKRNVFERAKRLSEGILQGKDTDTLLYEFEQFKNEIESSEDNYDDSIQSITAALFEDFNSETETGFNFGIDVLDKTIGGLFKTEVTTIGAKSGVGKTALALFIALNVAIQGKKVLIITREMTNKHIVQRLITRLTAISSNKMKKKTFDSDDWVNIVGSISELNKQNIFINDKISTVSGIRKRVKNLKPDLVIVDYLQLLTPEGKDNSREREVATLSRGLKEMAQSFEIPVIQLTQLNDGFKGRPYGEGAVRESRAIYQDSNNVIYIHKPIDEKEIELMVDPLMDKDKAKKQIDFWLNMNIGDSSTKIIEMIVSKSRDGGTAIEKMWYEGETLSYKNF